MSDQQTSVDLDAIEARGRSPWCTGCGETRHKCACDEQPSDGQLIVSLVAEMRRLLATLDERDKQIVEVKNALDAARVEADRLRERIRTVLPYVIATLPYPDAAMLHSSVTTSNPEWVAIHGGRGRSSARQLMALLDEAHNVKAAE